ncbi:MAG: hypothetical protein HY517_04065 [Candidatus Aenigmarchaeota archaeon]|nr:hypothetical protein [Candidatus Aenigmarchaeota archaeon]
MDKSQIIAIVLILAVSFTFGCAQTQSRQPANTPINQTIENVSEDDNLGPALQELQELEGL